MHSIGTAIPTTSSLTMVNGICDGQEYNLLILRESFKAEPHMRCFTDPVTPSEAEEIAKNPRGQFPIFDTGVSGGFGD